MKRFKLLKDLPGRKQHACMRKGAIWVQGKELDNRFYPRDATHIDIFRFTGFQMQDEEWFKELPEETLQSKVIVFVNNVAGEYRDGNFSQGVMCAKLEGFVKQLISSEVRKSLKRTKNKIAKLEVFQDMIFRGDVKIIINKELKRNK